MDSITTININGTPVEVKNGRVEYTFVSDGNPITINELQACLGDTHLQHIQLEQNGAATEFQAPSVGEHMLNRWFRDFNQLKFDMYDNEGLRTSKLLMNNQLLDVHFSELLKGEGTKDSYFTQTASVIQQLLTDQRNGLESRITQTASSLQVQITDAVNEMGSRITLTEEGVSIQLADLKEGLLNEITTTANGLRSEISTTDKNLRSLITQTANGIAVDISNAESRMSTKITATEKSLQSEISSADKGVRSLITQTESSLTQKISSTDGRVSTLSSSLNGLVYRLGTDTKVAQIVLNDYSFKRELSNATADNITISQVEQSAKSVTNQILRDGSAITQLNLSPTGVKIKGSLITLDGNTYMTNAFARSLMVDRLTANDMTAFMGKFSYIIANNLDVNNISGNRTEFIQSLWRSAFKYVYIDGTGVEVQRTDGTTSVRLDDTGMSLFNLHGAHAGRIGVAKWVGTTRPVLRLSSQQGTDISFGVYGTDSYVSAMRIDGDSKRTIRFNSDLMFSNDSIGIKWYENYFDGVRGVYIMNTSYATSGKIFLSIDGRVAISTRAGVSTWFTP